MKPSHSTALLAALGLSALSAPALACGNAMQLITRGVFPDMFWAWFAAFTITVFIYYFDQKRAEPLSTRSRVYVALAMFALATVTFAIYYGVTVDPDDWRWWDLMNNPWDPNPEVYKDVTF